MLQTLQILLPTILVSLVSSNDDVQLDDLIINMGKPSSVFIYSSTLGIQIASLTCLFSSYPSICPKPHVREKRFGYARRFVYVTDTCMSCPIRCVGLITSSCAACM